MQPQNGFHFTTYIHDLEQTKDIALNYGKKWEVDHMLDLDEGKLR